MLLHWVLTTVVLVQFIIFLLKRNPKSKPSSSGARIGLMEALGEIMVMLLYKNIPNYETAVRLQKKFGDFFVMSFPFMPAQATISDLTLAKRIMSSSEWLNRCWDNHYLHSTTFNKPIGLLFANGDHWKEARRLTMKILHQLNFYRGDTMEKLMAVEIGEVEEHLKMNIKESGNGSVTLSPHQMFEINTLNIICQIIMGKRFRRDDDPFVQRMLSAFNVANREFNAGFSIVDVFPSARHVPKLTFVDSFKEASHVVYEFFKEEMKQRRKAGTYRTQPSDFTDYFLLEIDEQSQHNSHYITDECFLTVMRDMIAAGMDTTNASLEHAIMHMVRNPHVQQKVQAEIDRVVGSSRMPTYSDRKRMPYTEAVILEILRYATPVPLTVRSPLEDNHINGVKMTKGSLCGINIYGIHRSENLWQDPYEFRPERFLNEQGNIVNADKIIPFGYGKRVCVGESVARVSLFMFFVSLMQNFTWEVSTSHPLPSLKGVPGLSRCPVPYYVTVRPRGSANISENVE